MRRLVLFLAVTVSTACAQPATPGVPPELLTPAAQDFLTPETRRFLQTEEGKKVVSAMHEVLLAEQRRNEADPELAAYYRLLRAKDFEGAFREIRGPAEKGHAQAQTELGFLYQSGTGVEKNVDEAIAWYTKAADQGNLMAASNLGAIHMLPQFGHQDFARAQQLLRPCAIKLRSSCVTGMSYLYMARDVQDLPLAFAWASLGSDFGIAGSQSQANQLEPQMTAQDLESAVKAKSALVMEIGGRAPPVSPR